nr:unnamed protein product [Digitaria exilis]
MAWASQLPPGYSIEWELTSSEDREEFALPTLQPKLKRSGARRNHRPKFKGSEARSVTKNYQETKLTP